jgi:hypothetical protein
MSEQIINLKRSQKNSRMTISFIKKAYKNIINQLLI